MKLKRNVVMLPTNEKAAPILSYLDDKHLQYFPNDCWSNKDLTKRHLYLISDEEIKEGDWYIIYDAYNNIDSIKKADYNKTNEFSLKPYSDYCKRITSSTNKSLGLPSPSDSFIKKFIERYNEGYPITDVMIEYEPDYSIHCNISANECLTYHPDIKDCKDCPHCKQKLKVDKNNCITIRPVKNHWTREEVIVLTRDAFDNSCKYSSHKEWIKQNL